MIVRAVTAGAANAVASPARQRSYLAILNQSVSATVYVAFDQAAVAAAVAGQLTIGPISASTAPDATNTVTPSAVFHGIDATPWQAINIIASAAATPVTIFES